MYWFDDFAALPSCNCTNKCIEKFEIQEIVEMRKKLWVLSEKTIRHFTHMQKERERRIFFKNFILQQIISNGNLEKFSVLGYFVCLKGFCSIFGYKLRTVKYYFKKLNEIQCENNGHIEIYSQNSKKHFVSKWINEFFSTNGK